MPRVSTLFTILALSLTQPAFANGPLTGDDSYEGEDTIGGGLKEDPDQEQPIELLNLSVRITEVDES